MAPSPRPHIDSLLVTADATHEALKHWQDSDSGTSPLQGLATFRLAQARSISPAAAQRTVLNNALAELAAVDGEQARLLQLRFVQGLTADDAGRQLHLASSTVFRRQREAIEHLAAIINLQERQEQMAHQAVLEQRLRDRTYSTLVGVEDQIAQLAALLRAQRPPFLLAIEGLGGLGKTALADALARKMIGDFAVADLAWVTARQQSLNLGGAIKLERERGIDAGEVIALIFSQLWQPEPAPIALSHEQKLHLLHQRLKQAPHLIVIDNLETIADLVNLLPVIRQLADPSKFLLTSRQSLYSETGVYHHLLQDLSRGHALQLLRQEAAEHNITQLVKASDEDLQPIYDTVAGNPLALRLVAAQARFHPLPRVLDGLKQARGLPVVNLYNYIYRQSWNDLDPIARQVFLAMPLLTQDHGGDLAQIAATSGLPEDIVSHVLDNLVTRNLVNVLGSLTERHYAIHSLTRTFLHEIARWE
jgi:hypothetical protein